MKIYLLTDGKIIYNVRSMTDSEYDYENKISMLTGKTEWILASEMQYIGINIK